MEKLTYFQLQQKLTRLKKTFEYFEFGKSTLGEEILGFHIGSTSGKQILVEAGIHAREYISTLATIEEMKYLKSNFMHFNFGVYFIPLMNPDGVRLVLDGPSFISNKTLKKYLFEINNSSSDFSLWKANILGVDLNSNFNALWGKGKFNRFSPGPAGFVGYYPNSEIENANLIRFLKEHKIAGSLSIHSKGEVVYYGYDNLSKSKLTRDKRIAESLASYLNFTPEKTEQSVGGVSDYISEIYGVPALTIELGSDDLTHPISSLFLHKICQNFLGVTNTFIDLLNKKY